MHKVLFRIHRHGIFGKGFNQKRNFFPLPPPALNSLYAPFRVSFSYM